LNLGTSMIAESWNGINYLKSYAVPRNPRTPRQQSGRRRFADAVAAWRALAPEERRAYAREARDLPGEPEAAGAEPSSRGVGKKRGARAPVGEAGSTDGGISFHGVDGGLEEKRAPRRVKGGDAGIGSGSHGGYRTRSVLDPGR